MNFGTVLITGGAGFIGTQLAIRLVPHAKKIILLDDLTTGNRAAIPKAENISFYEQSVLDEEGLEEILPDVQYIFHTAARNLVMSTQSMKADLLVNTLGTMVLLEGANKYCKDLKRFVYTSTSSIYGEATQFPTKEHEKNITAPYAASKYAAEQYVSLYHKMEDVPTAIVRLSNVYGPGQLITNPYCGVVAKFFDAVDEGNPTPIFGDGVQTRDFTYIDDAVDALLRVALQKEAIGEIYNVGTGVETSIAELSQFIARLYGNGEYPVSHVPKRDIDTILRRQLSNEKIKEQLNWEPKHSVLQGLQKTYEWLQRTK